MKLQTIQEYAISIGTTPQNVRNKKKLPLVKLPLYVKHNGSEIQVGEQLFIEVENKS